MHKFLTLTVIGLMMLTATACKKHHHDDHAELNGFKLLQNGRIVAQQNGTTVSGAVTISVGTANPVFTVVFVEADGHDYSDFSAEDSLLVEVANTSVAAVQAGPGRWEFRLNGIAQGTTTITVNLMHSGHKDFESRPVPVTVGS